MKCYYCLTSEGPKLASTQAEAKALDPKFEPAEVPLDKPSLLAYINVLLRQGHTSHPDGEAEVVEDAEAAPPPPTPSINPQSMMPPHAVRNEIQGAWEEFIWDIPAKEVYRLDVLQRVIEERRREIQQGH